MSTRFASLVGLFMLGVFTSSHAAEAVRGADAHVSRGVTCQACHGQDLKNPQTPTIETCSSCHEVKALVQKTAKVKPTNPHTSPHYGDQLDCTNCHVQHSETTNYCANCHTFDFQVK